MDTRAPATPPLIDRFGRHVTYVRLSVTDRCDLRCVYCMNEQMTFLPKARILTLEEMALIGRAFVELGPKGALSRMISQILKDREGVKSISVSNLEQTATSLEALA